MKLIVLWVLFSTNWALGPIPMGPGWFSTKHVYTVDMTVECVTVGIRMIERPYIIDYACVAAGNAPPGDMAEMKPSGYL